MIAILFFVQVLHNLCWSIFHYLVLMIFKLSSTEKKNKKTVLIMNEAQFNSLKKERSFATNLN